MASSKFQEFSTTYSQRSSPTDAQRTCRTCVSMLASRWWCTWVYRSGLVCTSPVFQLSSGWTFSPRRTNPTVSSIKRPYRSGRRWLARLGTSLKLRTSLSSSLWVWWFLLKLGRASCYRLKLCSCSRSTLRRQGRRTPPIFVTLLRLILRIYAWW